MISNMHRLLMICILVGVSNAMIYVGHHIKNEVVQNGKLRSLLHKYSNNTSLDKCANFDNELNLVSSEAETCLDRTYNSDEITFCDYVKSNLRDCFNSTNALLEKCVPDKSQNVFLFLVDSTIDLLKAVCAAPAADVIELVQPCVIDAIRVSDNMCFDSVENDLLSFELNSSTKSDMCKTLQSYRTCIYSELHRKCSSAITTRTFFKYFDAWTNKCTKP